jgi:hypothetical protein
MKDAARSPKLLAPLWGMRGMAGFRWDQVQALGTRRVTRHGCVALGPTTDPKPHNRRF